MKVPAWFPTVTAWASAVALLVFSRAFLVAAGIILPLLMEVARVSPRMAAVGGLALWLSPIVLVALGHRVVSGVLDVRDGAAARKRAPRLLHGWAGLYGWLVIFFATSVTLFLGVVIDPPPVEPEGLLGALGWAVGTGATLGARTVVWVLVAAILYRFEQRARGEHAQAA